MESFLLCVFCLVGLGGEAGEDGEAEVACEDEHHDNGAVEGCFCLHAVAGYAGVVDGRAGFCDIPGRTVLGVFRVAGVGAGLVGDGYGVDSDEGGVDEDGKDGWEDVADVHDAFRKHEEHREHCNDHVVVCDAGIVSRLADIVEAQGIHTTVTILSVWCMACSSLQHIAPHWGSN